MSNGRKRTKVVLNKEIALVRELHIEDMVIINRSGKRDYLKRLCYLNVPTLRQIARGGEILANRDNIVRDIYNILFPLPDSHSKQAYFQGVIYYFRYLDEIKYEKDSFDNEIMHRCIQHYNRLRNNGQQKSKSLSVKTSLSFFLRQWNREADLKCLPLVSIASESKVLPFHTETELKPLAKVLVKGALAFQRAIEGKIFLDIHPFYDEKEFSIIAKKNDWSPHQVAYKKNGFKNCM